MERGGWRGTIVHGAYVPFCPGMVSWRVGDVDDERLEDELSMDDKPSRGERC
jgi:hypothetical protein